MTDKKLLKLNDIRNIYNISKTSIWRLRNRESDPFPAPLETTFKHNTCLFDAKQVDDWFSRNVRQREATNASIQ